MLPPVSCTLEPEAPQPEPRSLIERMRHKPAPSSPQLPKIQLELIEDVSPELPKGFLKLIRRRYRARYPDGSSSKPFLYDQIDRAALDAVVICAHYPTSEGRFVYLRSALRPPLADRDPRREPFTAKGSAGGLWELPAGMIEVRDQCAGGPQLTAQRELYEEVGFQIPLATLKPLGPVTFPAPGFVAERPARRRQFHVRSGGSER